MRGPFARFRQERADDRELGTGLWRRSHDRYARALDRYFQVLQDPGAPDALSAEERNGVVHAGNVLAERLADVRVLARRMHAELPGDGEQHIPPAAGPVHRELSRASHELAAAAQAVVMFRRGLGGADAVSRHAQRTLDHVERAQELARDI